MAIDLVRERGRWPRRPTPGEARADIARLVGIESVEVVGEGVAVRNAVPRCHEPTQEIILDLATLAHAKTGFAPERVLRLAIMSFS